jgi:hypothetical protein
MPGSSYSKTLGNGFIGNIAAGPYDEIGSDLVAANSAAIPFGTIEQWSPNNDGTVMAPNATTLVAANVAGIAGAEVITNNAYPSNGAGASYIAGEMASSIKKGAITVAWSNTTTLGAPTPYKGCPVYVRTVQSGTVPLATAPLFGFETASDAGKNFLLTGAQWTCAPDANNVAGIILLNRIAA